ncbi:hypothetical protein [Bauldia litoralis]|uniref:hypothetical protein n=1 Tax=Bauldia litoralis TaxID=665467 RepID=UPI0032639F6C
MAAGFDREELRALVRQALKESLGAATPPVATGGGLAGELRAAAGRGKPATVSVAAGSGADLGDFARAILEASEDTTVKAAIVAGDIRFEPTRPAQQTSAAVVTKPATPTGGTFELASGILGEAKIVEISRNHRKILVGSDVVLTPLARDKAREMKVELVRQKP